MWDEAAKNIQQFSEGVLTMLDTEGYPISVRVNTRAYNAATGELSATVPTALRPAAGPANLSCHFHDEKMWGIKFATIKGEVLEREGTWVFVSKSFEAPRKLAFLSFVMNARTASQKYLDKRGLKRPTVNWTATKGIWRK